MTYSITARDKKTGHMGIAVQTHWFGVGNNVPWLEAGVGAIATQAMTNMDYGKKGLELLQGGKGPSQVIQIIGDTDESFEMRQVAVIDNAGNMAAHTGKNCVKYAGYLLGDECIVQGNILANDTVLSAMLDAYNAHTDKELGERLLLSIEAGEKAGGELRGVQSAALRVVSGTKGEYDILNIRVDDNSSPLAEIRRQLNVQKAYNMLMDAGQIGNNGNVEESMHLYGQVENMMPNNKEVLFWKAFTLKNNGESEQAQEILDQNFGGEGKWLELWDRIS